MRFNPVKAKENKRNKKCNQTSNQTVDRKYKLNMNIVILSKLTANLNESGKLLVENIKRLKLLITQKNGNGAFSPI